MTRAAPLADADYDVVIIGGGIAGAGAARDLALRGVSVALLDKGDFGSGTTSKSSKLVHGGLRYLELFDFALVRESLRERETLGRLAPHLVKSLPFLVPIYRESSRSLIKVRLGLRLYDWLTPGGDRERYRVADVEEVVRDARGTLTGVKVRDLLTGQVVTLGARVIVNATGPWVDQIRERARVTERGRRIVRTTKGIHCLLPRLTERAVYHATGDDRMIFVIPWRGFSLVGTTDTDFDGDLDRLQATRAEVDYLLAEVRKAIPDPRVAAGNVAYTYAGVRPLTWEDNARASDVSRAHKVIGEEDGRFLSITGTKLTCFRSLAAQLGDHVLDTLDLRARSRTAELTLDGADEAVGRTEAHAWLDVSPETATTGLSRDTLETLVTTYGRGYHRVIEMAGKVAGGGERLCPANPDIVAQLHLAVQDELAVSLQDVLLRRTGIGTSACQGLDCAESIADRMAALLGWRPRRREAELDAYRAHVARAQRFKA